MYDKVIKGAGPELIFRPAPLYESANNNGNQDELTNDNSYADEPVDYTGYIEDSALVGEYPFNVIVEGIRNQFSNYISTEDRTNYVEIFYNQYHTSYELAEDENFIDDIKEAIDGYLDKFLALMRELFYNRLTITINALDGEATDASSIEVTIKKLYEFFILNAKQNFTSVIVKSLYPYIDPNLDDKAFYDRIHELMGEYSAMITTMGPNEFLTYCNDEEIMDIFNSGAASGNFLRKYSPRLYQHEEFECDIVSELMSTVMEVHNKRNGDE